MGSKSTTPEIKRPKKFKDDERALLEDLTSGKLHKAAEDATRKSGWARSSGDEFVDVIEADDDVPCSGSSSTPM